MRLHLCTLSDMWVIRYHNYRPKPNRGNDIPYGKTAQQLGQCPPWAEIFKPSDPVTGTAPDIVLG